jgi:predicted ABC-type exoprotein transport system permease subunit
MTAYKLILSLHGLLGLLALATYWTAGLSEKGSPIHRAAGKIYLLAMVVLLLSAAPLALRVLLYKNQSSGIFFLYLLVIVTTSVWVSWRAIRDKRDWARFAGPIYRGLAWLNLASGLVVLLIGLFWTAHQLIFIGFSAIGLLGGYAMLRFARQSPDNPRWWLIEHLRAMLANGVATHIAFLAIGLPKVLPMLAGPALQNFAWLAPLVIAVVARTLLGRKYLPVASPKAVAQTA